MRLVETFDIEPGLRSEISGPTLIFIIAGREGGSCKFNVEVSSSGWSTLVIGLSNININLSAPSLSNHTLNTGKCVPPPLSTPPPSQLRETNNQAKYQFPSIDASYISRSRVASQSTEWKASHAKRQLIQ